MRLLRHVFSLRLQLSRIKWHYVAPLWALSVLFINEKVYREVSESRHRTLQLRFNFLSLYSYCSIIIHQVVSAPCMKNAALYLIGGFSISCLIFASLMILALCMISLSPATGSPSCLAISE